MPDDSAVAIEETLAVLDDLVKSGKVRYIGVSNETPWGVMQYLRCSEQQDFARIVSIQNPYNLLNRSFETGLAEISHREHVGLLAYSPLAFGVLTGKYLNASPANARLTLFPHYQRYSNPNGKTAAQAYVRLAGDCGLSPAQMALAFITSRAFVTSSIIGATTTEQLKENIASCRLELPVQVFDALEEIHQRFPNPCP